MKKAYHTEAETIKKTLLSLIPKLPNSGKIFLLFRLYRIYGEYKYLQILKDYAVETNISNLDYYIKHNFSRSIISKEIPKLYPLSEQVPKKLKRNVYINKNDKIHDLILFKKVITDFEYLNRINLIKDLNPTIYTQTQNYIHETYPKIISFIENSSESVLFAPVQIVNSLYLTKFLPNSPYREEDETLLFKIIKDNYTDREIEDPIVFLNYLYTLTHIIIGESQFYNHHISNNTFDWIWGEFEDMEAKIFSTNEVDIIAEIGVCWGLNMNSKKETLEKYQNIVSKYFSKQYGYIPSRFYQHGSFEDLNFCKHRNILALILLSGMKKLYSIN